MSLPIVPPSLLQSWLDNECCKQRWCTTAPLAALSASYTTLQCTCSCLSCSKVFHTELYHCAIAHIYLHEEYSVSSATRLLFLSWLLIRSWNEVVVRVCKVKAELQMDSRGMHFHLNLSPRICICKSRIMTWSSFWAVNYRPLLKAKHNVASLMEKLETYTWFTMAGQVLMHVICVVCVLGLENHRHRQVCYCISITLHTAEHTMTSSNFLLAEWLSSSVMEYIEALDIVIIAYCCMCYAQDTWQMRLGNFSLWGKVQYCFQTIAGTSSKQHTSAAMAKFLFSYIMQAHQCSQTVVYRHHCHVSGSIEGPETAQHTRVYRQSTVSGVGRFAIILDQRSSCFLTAMTASTQISSYQRGTKIDLWHSIV